MKRYGIFLGYSPRADLRSEGLGRHLASFLTAAFKRDDVRFSIACPSWTRERLIELCREHRIDASSIDFIGPRRKPLLLLAHDRYQRWRRKTRRSRKLKGFLREASSRIRSMLQRPVRAVVGVRNPWLVPVVILALVLAVVVALLLDVCRFAVRAATRIRRAPHASSARPESLTRSGTRGLLQRINRAVEAPSRNRLTGWLFGLLEENEMAVVLRCIANREDIAAWYCTAPFWPEFNEIEAPRLQCVPDVVLTEFPVGFARISSERAMEAPRKIDLTIEGGDRFVTYSDEIRQKILLDRFHVDRNRTHVILHGTDQLDDLIRVSGFPDDDVATNAFCRSVFAGALAKSIGHPNPYLFACADVRFLFYASQFRPSKNLHTLLRALDELLRGRHISMKLVLTGNPGEYPPFRSTVEKFHLGNDVLCLHGLTRRELAACYRLAQLAINPSLAEGGMPFTFAEAVSIGTPVVMSDIAVTREVIVDPELRARTLFDPYDAMAVADAVESALADREALYALQRRFFDESLVKRSWDDVVAEHVDILDHISGLVGNRGAA